MKKSVKGFQGSDEYVAILYEVEPKDLVIQRYPQQSVATKPVSLTLLLLWLLL
jgi:hypothetical protein